MTEQTKKLAAACLLEMTAPEVAYYSRELALQLECLAVKVCLAREAFEEVEGKVNPRSLKDWLLLFGAKVPSPKQAIALDDVRERYGQLVESRLEEAENAIAAIN